MRATRAVHQPLQANLIVEPASAKVVPLLEALPATESLFYKEEANVVELLGRVLLFWTNCKLVSVL